MDGSGRVPELRYVITQEAQPSQDDVRRMAWWDWPAVAPDREARPHIVICVHGLSRQGRDFDTLAMALRDCVRVVAVDVAGRGHSDWLKNPMQYQLGTYVSDLQKLLALLKAEMPGARIDWVGTSMGGLVGIVLAALPESGISRLVLNDVGPALSLRALERIAGYLGKSPVFDTPEEASEYLRSISSGFGPHTAEQWSSLSRPMLRERDGKWVMHYDPSIAAPLNALLFGMGEESRDALFEAGESALWAAYEAISAPTLLLRGAQSDLLEMPTVEKMMSCGPKARFVEFAGVGHAPTLVVADQVQAVREFLLMPE